MVALRACLFLIGWGAWSSWSVAAEGAASRVVDVEISRREGGADSTDALISPYVYGLGTYMREDRTEADTWSLRPGSFRFGGNMAERFNWKVNSWNAGADWYFKNDHSRFPDMVDRFLLDNAAHGVASAVTVPMLGWVAKDDHSQSFPAKGSGGREAKADPHAANVAIDAAFVEEWVRHLKPMFGKGAPRHYIIGNEPMLWHKAHRDVHPEPATYDEVLAKYLATAAAVRRADAEAVIVGPALWGFLAMEQSAFDERGPWSAWRKRVDRARHDDRPFLAWFLDQVVAEEKRRGVSLIDVVDVHHYPETKDVRSGRPAKDDVVRRARLASTRSLWDKSYRDDSWIDQEIFLIPRLQDLARAAKPGLRVAIGEYNFRGEDDAAGAVAQAEALGVFGAFGAYSANYWTIPPVDSGVAAAFRVFRNYDGHGAAFGDRRLSNSVGTRPEESVFAASSDDRRVVTVVLTNKSTTAAASFRVHSKLFAKDAAPRVFTWQEGQGGKLKATAVPPPRPGEPIDIVLPPLAFALVEGRAVAER